MAWPQLCNVWLMAMHLKTSLAQHFFGVTFSSSYSTVLCGQTIVDNVSNNVWTALPCCTSACPIVILNNNKNTRIHTSAARCWMQATQNMPSLVILFQVYARTTQFLYYCTFEYFADIFCGSWKVHECGNFTIQCMDSVGIDKRGFWWKNKLSASERSSFAWK